jgi:NADPH:quinone reductase-like Zn-dependent oxidoreductase
MEQTPTMMRAVALDKFGGVETLTLQTVAVPEIAPDEVLIRVETAGIGEWDPFEREGGYAQMLGLEARFPYVLGSEGAGTIAALGSDVRGFEVGDQVYAAGFLNPKGGFYAEYAVVNANTVSHIPANLTVEQAGVMSGVGITALRGLDDTLKLKAGETVAIFGASGGVGHMAVQLAKRMGARVFAVASGADGVALAEQLGSDVSVDGRKDDVLASARAFAPEGFDAVLLTAGGEAAEKLLQAVRPGGRVAYPMGIQPEPQAPPRVQINGYYGEPDADIIRRFNHLVESGPFTVHIARTFPLEQAAEAHAALNQHYLGKLALQISR